VVLLGGTTADSFSRLHAARTGCGGWST